MLRAKAEIFLRVPEGEKVKLLTNSECEDLVNWEAEKYRRELLAIK